MTKQRMIITAAILVSASALQPLLAEDPNLGRTIGLTCYGCHGADGVSKGSVPSLKGMNQSQVVAAMNDFKSGKRQGTIMDRICKGYNDEQIDALGKFVEGL